VIYNNVSDGYSTLCTFPDRTSTISEAFFSLYPRFREIPAGYFGCHAVTGSNVTHNIAFLCCVIAGGLQASKRSNVRVWQENKARANEVAGALMTAACVVQLGTLRQAI